MENTGQNGYSNPRLDRIEGLLNIVAADHVAFADEHKKLLIAQVVLTDRLDKLAVSVQELREAQKATDERLKDLNEATDGRLSALIAVVDDLVRNRPSQ